MSISSEISRISGNVSAALTAIGNKGVTVPAGSNSDDLADLIGSITGDLDTKSITFNGTYSAEDDNVDGYSEVTVNVQNGATMTEVANTYGTGVVITSAQGAGPSATRHTLYFEYEDESTETVYAYYDDALISSAITATTPTTHNNKTVTLAQLDGTTWYSYTPPSGDWQTYYDGNITVSNKEFHISSLDDLFFASGETWRVTLDGTQYIYTTEYYSDFGLYYIGNFELAGGGDSDGDPILIFNIGNPPDFGFMGYSKPDGTHTLKLEKQVTA